MKRLIKRTLRYLGYDILRVDKYPTQTELYDKAKNYPYIEQFEMKTIRFRHWITDDIFKSWYDPINQRDWCVNEGYLRLVRRSDKILEVGCQIGFTTCLLRSAVGEDGFVVGMDIVPVNCLIANSQIGLNAFQNCHILNLAAADFHGKVRVNNVHNGSVELHRIENTINIDAIRCDELIDQYGYFDVLKIDVEGFETSVLKGCTELLSKKPRLLVELHGSELRKYGSNYRELFQLINANGYEGYMCVEQYKPDARNQLEEFNLEFLIASDVHANIFLRPKSSTF